MNTKTIGIIVAIIVVVIGGWYLFSGGSNAPAADLAPTTATTTATVPSVSGAVTINYTNSGFSPASVSVSVGTEVTFVNQSGDEMWIASNPHPSHTLYDGTTKNVHCASGYTGPAPLDECTAVGRGGTFAFTFDKAGTWGYHNHGNANDGGTVIVTATANSASVTQ